MEGSDGHFRPTTRLSDRHCEMFRRIKKFYVFAWRGVTGARPRSAAELKPLGVGKSSSKNLPTPAKKDDHSWPSVCLQKFYPVIRVPSGQYHRVNLIKSQKYCILLKIWTFENYLKIKNYKITNCSHAFPYHHIISRQFHLLPR